MGVSIDLEAFHATYDVFKSRVRDLPRVLVREAGILVEHVMKIHSPYLTGAQKSSIFPEWQGNKIMVTPHVYYAVYNQHRGKSAGWVERTEAAAEPLMDETLNARAEEYLEGGR